MGHHADALVVIAADRRCGIIPGEGRYPEPDVRMDALREVDVDVESRCSLPRAELAVHRKTVEFATNADPRAFTRIARISWCRLQKREQRSAKKSAFSGKKTNLT